MANSCLVAIQLVFWPLSLCWPLYIFRILPPGTMKSPPTDGLVASGFRFIFDREKPWLAVESYKFESCSSCWERRFVAMYLRQKDIS